MPVERFFSSSPLTNGSYISIEEEEFHHLAHVIRCKPGDIVELVNGNGVLAKGKILTLLRSCASIEILSSSFFSPPSYSLTLVQGIPRTSRLEMILEKGVELGVTHFQLVQAELSEKKGSPATLKRLQYILTSALKQSGRLYLPSLTFAPPIKEWHPFSEDAFFGDTNKEASPIKDKVRKGRPTLIVIGPEKGFTEKEVSHMRSIGMQGISLNQNILRTDTAAIASLAIAAALLT